MNRAPIGATATAVSPPFEPIQGKHVPFGWRERWKAAPEIGANAWRALGLVARADKGLLVQLLAGQLLDATLTVAITAVGPKIIDAIVGHAARTAITWVVLELLLVLAKTAASQWNTFTGVMLGPTLFGAWVTATGSYGAGFFALAALGLVGAGLLIKRYE